MALELSVPYPPLAGPSPAHILFALSLTRASKKARRTQGPAAIGPVISVVEQPARDATRLQGFNRDLLYPKEDIDWIKKLHVVANKRVHLTNLALLTISELPAASLDDCEKVLNRFRALPHGAALERIPFTNHTSQTNKNQ